MGRCVTLFGGGPVPAPPRPPRPIYVDGLDAISSQEQYESALRLTRELEFLTALSSLEGTPFSGRFRFSGDGM